LVLDLIKYLNQAFEQWASHTYDGYDGDSISRSCEDNVKQFLLAERRARLQSLEEPPKKLVRKEAIASAAKIQSQEIEASAVSEAASATVTLSDRLVHIDAKLIYSQYDGPGVHSKAGPRHNNGNHPG
jgi:hypothetical protein